VKLDDGFGDQRLSLDVTPLLDVVFILVLFFAVTTSFISPRELDALKGNVVSLSEDKRSLDQEVQRVSAALDARVTELTELDAQHRELRVEHAQMLEAKRAEVAALEQRLDDQLADGEKMRWMMAALEEDKAGIEKTLADSRQRNTSLREQLEQAYRDYQGVQIELTGLREQHRSQSVALAGARTSLAGARDRATALDARVAALSSTLDEKAQREVLLQALIQEKAAQAAATAEQLGTSQQRAETLAGRIATLESDLGARADDERLLRALLAEKAEEAAALGQRLSSTQGDRDALQRELAGLRALSAQQADRLAGLSASVEQKSQRERLLQALIQEKAAEAAATQDRLGTSQERGAALERSIAALQTDLQTRADDERLLRALLAEKASEASTLGQRLSAAETDRAVLDSELAGLRALGAEQAEQVRRLRTRLAEMDEELASYRKLADLDREQIERIVRAQDRLRAGLGEYLKDNRIDITRDRERLTLQLSDRILFPSGSASIRPAGLEVLRRLGELLRERLDVLEVQVGGHTDNVPLSGDRGGLLSDNWGLSAARAVSVVDFLEKEVGLDPDRLSAVGYGEHRPVAPNDTAEGRARNRRIELVLLPR